MEGRKEEKRDGVEERREDESMGAGEVMCLHRVFLTRPMRCLAFLAMNLTGSDTVKKTNGLQMQILKVTVGSQQPQSNTNKILHYFYIPV